MLIDLDFYYSFLSFWLVIAVITFFLLMFLPAPYGRHEKRGWGPRLSVRLGWILMECPCVILMSTFLVIRISSDEPLASVVFSFYIFWTIHYLHRSCIWPQRAHITGKKMPLFIVMMGIVFNVVNTLFNAEWIFNLKPEGYSYQWQWSLQFCVGAILFVGGMVTNLRADNVLFELRRKSKSEYDIPEGPLFRWSSCPNYAGEIVEWIGWAVMTWSLAGLSFAIWTAANLVPRAYAHHRWYHEKFPHYPKQRRALIPFVW